MNKLIIINSHSGGYHYEPTFHLPNPNNYCSQAGRHDCSVFLEKKFSTRDSLEENGSSAPTPRTRWPRYLQRMSQQGAPYEKGVAHYPHNFCYIRSSTRKIKITPGLDLLCTIFLWVVEVSLWLAKPWKPHVFRRLVTVDLSELRVKPG